MPINKPGSPRSSLDPVNRESSEAVYEEGFAARSRRLPIADCPYLKTNPFRLIWEAGWQAARIAEADCSMLLNSLHKVGLTTALLDLDPLDDQERFALIDWLDTRNVLLTPPKKDQQQFLARRPPWVIFTGQAIPAEDDQPELRVVAFEPPRQSLSLQSLSDELLCAGLNTSDSAAPVDSLHQDACTDHHQPAVDPQPMAFPHEAQALQQACPAVSKATQPGRLSSIAGAKTAPGSHALPPLQEQPPASEAESRLQDLLRVFDDVGVQLVEEQWLAFCDADRNFCTRWVRGRLQGIMSPVPCCLIPYATMQLKAEYAPYIDECRPTRSERLPITFDKPGVIAAGDDDEGKIRLIVKAPYEHLPGTLADRLFRATACRIHFSTRRPSQWDQQELFAAHPIYVTTSDIKGYKATSDDTSFSFTVDQQTLSIESAFKHLWGQAGTAIVERIGRATREPKAQHAAT